MKILAVALSLVILISSCKKDETGNNNFTCGDAITDADGNVYNTVQIGSQCWMKENLKVSSGIPEVTDDTLWRWNTTPAWCYYDNDPANGATYGKLYNWYAVETGSLCPSGWHIPTDAEWQTLEMSLGMSQTEADQVGGPRGDSANIGGQLQATNLWNNPNTDVTNSSGFTALPGGFRSDRGIFGIVGNSGIGNFGGLWSSSESNTFGAWYRFLTGGSGVARYADLKGAGYSCRCLRD